MNEQFEENSSMAPRNAGCVSDVVDFCNEDYKQCSFSYDYLVNGSLANYSQVYEALNEGVNDE